MTEVRGEAGAIAEETIEVGEEMMGIVEGRMEKKGPTSIRRLGKLLITRRMLKNSSSQRCKVKFCLISGKYSKKEAASRG
jgi:hypothetical protein